MKDKEQGKIKLHEKTYLLDENLSVDYFADIPNYNDSLQYRLKIGYENVEDNTTFYKLIMVNENSVPTQVTVYSSKKSYLKRLDKEVDTIRNNRKLLTRLIRQEFFDELGYGAELKSKSYMKQRMTFSKDEPKFDDVYSLYSYEKDRKIYLSAPSRRVLYKRILDIASITRHDVAGTHSGDYYHSIKECKFDLILK